MFSGLVAFLSSALVKRLATQAIIALGEHALTELKERNDNPVGAEDVERIQKAKAAYQAAKAVLK